MGQSLNDDDLANHEISLQRPKSVTVKQSNEDKSQKPVCTECGGQYHVQSDPVQAYDGVGMICMLCGKSRNTHPDLLLDSHYYTCIDCGAVDICSACYRSEKQKLLGKT